jgi:hypothetical protein
MRFGTVTGLTAALLGLAGLVSAGDPPRRESAPPSGRAPAPSLASTNKPSTAEVYTVIGHLEKRDRVITIQSGPRGPVYTVANREGKVLLEYLSLEQLRAQAPEIHEFIKGAVAGGSGAGTRTADARVRSSAMR